MVITSLDNEKVKYYYKLQKKKYRDLHNEFIVEGQIINFDFFDDMHICILPASEIAEQIKRELLKKVGGV